MTQWLRRRLRTWLGVDAAEQKTEILERYHDRRINGVRHELRELIMERNSEFRLRLSSLEASRAKTDAAVTAIYDIPTDDGDTIGGVIKKREASLKSANEDRLDASAAKLRGLTLEQYRADLAERKRKKAEGIMKLLDSGGEQLPQLAGGEVWPPLTFDMVVRSIELRFGEVVMADHYAPDLIIFTHTGQIGEGEPLPLWAKSQDEAVRAFANHVGRYLIMEDAKAPLRDRQLVWRTRPEITATDLVEENRKGWKVYCRFAIRMRGDMSYACPEAVNA